MAFVNIAKEQDRLLINADDISVITETKGKNGQGEEQTILAFSSFSEDNFLLVDVKSWNVDTDGCIQKIKEAAGRELIELPFIIGDQMTNIGRFFINPEAFNYIITSEPSIPDGKTEEHVALLMGLDGDGEIESYVPVSKVDELMLAVASVKPKLKRINPDEASIRFHKPGYVIYDPKKISRIVPNGYDIDLWFKNGGRVDFKVNSGMENIVEYYTKKKFSQLPKSEITEAQLDAISARAHNFESGFQTRLSRKFAKAVADGAENLVKIEGARQPLYTRTENINWVSRNKTSLSIKYSEASKDRKGLINHARTDFKTEEKAQKAVEKLAGKIAAGPS